jgi:hypothetical protein
VQKKKVPIAQDQTIKAMIVVMEADGDFSNLYNLFISL